MDLRVLGQSDVIGAAVADVALIREKSRRLRLRRLAFVLGPLAVWLWVRLVQGNPVTIGMPRFPAGAADYMPALGLILVLSLILIIPAVGSGRSPHILFRPSEIDIGLQDVKGAGTVVEEVVKTLNLFLAFRTFKERMGGTPRRAILFEGPPGTGKTYMAKAMAREAGVPFLFVSSSAFQSMYYGQTNRKIRSYFKALRYAARTEGGAIGFIEEIDAIGAARFGTRSSGPKEGVAGVVNELLIQLQSFDTPPASKRFVGWMIDRVNRWLPLHRQLSRPKPHPANILVIGATNRASDLDTALLRPGRFDRVIHFDLPSRSERREILDYYLDKKSHAAELDDAEARQTLAAMTFGYSPVMIEHLLDEALVWALRRGAEEFDWYDLQQAKLTEETGLKRPVEYTEPERRRIATHEAGHATIAYLVGKDRKLEVLSIIKRKDALGLLSHSDLEERFTKTRSEMISLIQITFGGMVAEELFFGEAGTGSAADLEGATTAAAQMFGSLGMAGTLISYEAIKGPMIDVVSSVLGTDEGREAVESILVKAKAGVTSMLRSYRHVIEALRDALLARDELIGDEITAVIKEAIRDAGLSEADPFEHPMTTAIREMTQQDFESRERISPEN